MLDPSLRAIAEHQARHALTGPVARLRPDETAHNMRVQAVNAGVLPATHGELNYRQLFPALDRGVYCGHHAVGRPSAQLVPALRDHLALLEQFGMGAFEHGWERLAERFNDRVCALLDRTDGDVLHAQNFSDGLSALLFAGLNGTLLCGEDHFTSARYLHHRWATHGTVHELPGDRDGWVPTAAYLQALGAKTTVVSLSTAHWRTGRVHDVAALTEAMSRVCPDAVLLLDVYQTLGTVPVPLGTLPRCSALIGGGVKQLHTGVGCGFVWGSDALWERLVPGRSGWFAHEEPLAFAPDFFPATGAARFQTGVPNLTAMAAFLAETDVLLALGADPIPQIHARIAATMKAAAAHAETLGLELVCAPEAAFLAVRTDAGQAAIEAAASNGVTIDFRPDTPEASGGILRLSTCAAGFAYELLYALEVLR